MTTCEVKEANDWTQPREGARGLFVKTANSSIRVAGTAGDEIQIHAVKTVRAVTEPAARAFLEQMRVEQRREGDRWMIEASWPSPPPREVDSAGVAFEVRAPAEMVIEAESRNGAVEGAGVAEAHLRTSNGSITARQIQVSVEARTSNGAVHVEECAGPVHAQTENGRVEVRRTRAGVRALTCNGAIQAEDCAGPVELKTENARIEVRRTQSEVRAHTCNGAIRIDGCPGPIEARTSSGEIAVHQARGPLAARTSDGRVEVDLEPNGGPTEAELTTSNGPIELRLPGSVSARLVADTSNARITMDRPGAGRTDVGSPHLETVLGAGEGSLRLRTSNGPIRIRLGD